MSCGQCGCYYLTFTTPEGNISMNLSLELLRWIIHYMLYYLGLWFTYMFSCMEAFFFFGTVCPFRDVGADDVPQHWTYSVLCPRTLMQWRDSSLYKAFWFSAHAILFLHACVCIHTHTWVCLEQTCPLLGHYLHSVARCNNGLKGVIEEKRSGWECGAHMAKYQEFFSCTWMRCAHSYLDKLNKGIFLVDSNFWWFCSTSD